MESLGINVVDTGKEKKGQLRSTPRFLTWVTDETVLPFTEIKEKKQV